MVYRPNGIEKLIFKDLSALQLKFDRRELNKIMVSARQAFASIDKDKKK